jgi:hypothetical protein
MQVALEDEASGLAYGAVFREYGLTVDDGGSSFLVIDFCPFCGVELPQSLRDAWFARLNDLGLEPENPRVPPEMRDASWWREASSEDDGKARLQSTGSRRRLRERVFVDWPDTDSPSNAGE